MKYGFEKERQKGALQAHPLFEIKGDGGQYEVDGIADYLLEIVAFEAMV